MCWGVWGFCRVSAGFQVPHRFSFGPSSWVYLVCFSQSVSISWDLVLRLSQLRFQPPEPSSLHLHDHTTTSSIDDGTGHLIWLQSCEVHSLFPAAMDDDGAAVSFSGRSQSLSICSLLSLYFYISTHTLVSLTSWLMLLSLILEMFIFVTLWQASRWVLSPLSVKLFL